MVCYIHKQTYAGETRPLERLVIPDVVIEKRKCARKVKKAAWAKNGEGISMPSQE